MKDVRNLFRLKKETNNNAIKGATNFILRIICVGILFCSIRV